MNIIKTCGLEIDLDSEVSPSHTEHKLLLRLLAHAKHQEHELKKLKRKVKKVMVSQDSLNASADRLEAGVHTIIGLLPGNSTPSTPDATVTAFQGRVDGASAALEAAIAGAGTPPPPPTP